MVLRKGVLIRAGLALFFLTAALAVVFPHLTGVHANYAVVNAPLISVRAPFDGEILRESPRLANPVATGQTLVELEATRGSKVELARLAARRRVLIAQIAALGDERRALGDLSRTFRDRLRRETQSAETAARSEIDVARAELTSADARIARLAHRIRRAEALTERNALAAREVEELRFDLAEAEAARDRGRAVIAARRHAFERAGDGAADTADVGHATRQRLDELAIRAIALDAEEARLRAELDGLAPLIAAVGEELQKLERFRPAAPTDGVVWSASRGPATTVAAGDEVMQLLDCSRRYIQVAFSERHFERIAPGTTAEVRLRGSRETIEARVTSLRGAAERPRGNEVPAIQRSEVLSEFTLFLDLAPVDPASGGRAAAFCDVGRSAEVRFDRPGSAAVGRFLGRIVDWLPERIRLATDAG